MSYSKWCNLAKTGRRPQSEARVKFKEEWPMVLDNQVSTRRGKVSGLPTTLPNGARLPYLAGYRRGTRYRISPGKNILPTNQLIYTNSQQANYVLKLYKSPQALGKALHKSLQSLPVSPRKRIIAMSELAKEVGVCGNKIAHLKHCGSLSPDVEMHVKNFYLRSDIVYTESCLKDVMVEWYQGKKNKAACLKETFAFITCLKDNNNSHELCYKEGELVRNCYQNYLKKKEEMMKKKKAAGDFVPEISAKQMDPVQLNKFLSHFPHRLKK